MFFKSEVKSWDTEWKMRQHGWFRLERSESLPQQRWRSDSGTRQSPPGAWRSVQLPAPASAFSGSGKDSGIYIFKRHSTDHTLKDNQATQEEMSVDASIKFVQGVKFHKIWSEKPEQRISGTHTWCGAYILLPPPGLYKLHSGKGGEQQHYTHRHISTISRLISISYWYILRCLFRHWQRLSSVWFSLWMDPWPLFLHIWTV